MQRCQWQVKATLTTNFNYLIMTPLQKGQWRSVCCVCAKRTHNIHYLFDLFAGHSIIQLASVPCKVAGSE
jgi:hypothetical protein